ncbi:TPA: hypothetical protein HA293_02125 [Candidatus Woesearchaeota archaeon]|nr:hypothetical protein [Candidatus Woesearchaeota archaeon]
MNKYGLTNVQTHSYDNFNEVYDFLASILENIKKEDFRIPKSLESITLVSVKRIPHTLIVCYETDGIKQKVYDLKKYNMKN